MMKRNVNNISMLERLSRLYQDNLFMSKPALDYLDARGLSLDSIKSFELGFCSDEDQSVHYLMDSGDEWNSIRRLGIHTDAKKDRFINRIIFPVKDINGFLVGFTARDITGDASAKYQNSEDSVFYKKSDNLYGIEKAKKSIFKHGFAFIVEGLFDCIQMHLAGFTNTVAILGTTMTESQVILLKVLCDSAVIMLDGDSAGQQAAAGLPAKLSKHGIMSEQFILPAGEDPASLIDSFGILGFRNEVYEKLKSKLCKISI